MSPRLYFAFLCSIVLHLGLFFPDIWRHSPAPVSPTLDVLLRPAPEPVFAESVLKNTLTDTPDKLHKEIHNKAPRDVLPSSEKNRQIQMAQREIRAAQKKLSTHLYYPPEAVRLGIEGEVRLLIVLADDGAITAVDVAASSGSILLDDAAIKAAYAMGGLAGSRSRELILPVVFRLQ